MSSERHPGARRRSVQPPPGYGTYPRSGVSDSEEFEIEDLSSAFGPAPSATSLQPELEPHGELDWDDDDRTTRNYDWPLMALTRDGAGEVSGTVDDEVTSTQRIEPLELEALRRRLRALDDQPTALAPVVAWPVLSADAEHDVVMTQEVQPVNSPLGRVEGLESDDLVREEELAEQRAPAAISLVRPAQQGLARRIVASGMLVLLRVAAVLRRVDVRRLFRRR